MGVEGEENIWCVRELGGRGRAGKAAIFNAKISNLQHPYVTVLCRSWRLFRCIFRSHFLGSKCRIVELLLRAGLICTV